MVVISIISLLSSLFFASTKFVRAKGRDAVRVQEIGQVRTALELYFADYRHYPIPIDGASVSVGDLVLESASFPLGNNQPLKPYLESITPGLFDMPDGPASEYYTDEEGSAYELMYQTETDAYTTSSGCIDPLPTPYAGGGSSCAGNNVITPLVPNTPSVTLTAGLPKNPWDGTNNATGTISWTSIGAQSCKLTSDSEQKTSVSVISGKAGNIPINGSLVIDVHESTHETITITCYSGSNLTGRSSSKSQLIEFEPN